MTEDERPPTSWHANHLNNAARLFGLAILVVVAFEVYRYLLRDLVSGWTVFWAYLALWLFSAYIVLPRLYRILSKIFLPNYFIGRTQTGDGLLGDPVNLAIIGTRRELEHVMTTAGWHKAAPLGFGSSVRIAVCTVGGKSYPDAPVSPLYLFHQKQDLAFEKDVDENPRKRHHVRFWKTPENWWLPGGFRADWLGAATYDKNVGLSLFTGQITHKIDANVDGERDFVVRDVKAADKRVDVRMVEHFTTSYHSRNGGGDLIHTDGALTFVTLPN